MSFVFNSDPRNPWAYWDNLFTKDECKEIIKIGTLLDQIDAEVSEKNIIDKEARMCKLSWMKFNKDTKFIYEKISSVVINLNEKFFQFNLTGFVEDFQFTEYNAPSNFYTYHTDTLHGGTVRKLSVTLQLTPQEQYEGGDLELFYDSKPEKMKKDVGRLVVFPSYALHRVLPVTKGTRHSLVGWVNGPPFK
jgi:PKHD-type hydroxylase